MINKKKIIQVLFFLGIIICIVVFGVVENNNPKTNSEVFLKNLHICTNTHDYPHKKTNKPNIIIENNSVYYACGHLLADSETVLDLYVFSTDEKKVVYSNPVNESFSPGVFFSKINLNSLPVGEYCLEVSKGRKTLSKFDFYLEE